MFSINFISFSLIYKNLEKSNLMGVLFLSYDFASTIKLYELKSFFHHTNNRLKNKKKIKLFILSYQQKKTLKGLFYKKIFLNNYSNSTDSSTASYPTSKSKSSGGNSSSTVHRYPPSISIKSTASLGSCREKLSIFFTL